MSEVTFPLRGATRTNLPVLHIGRTHVLGKFMIIEIYETYSGRMEVFEMESGRMEVFEMESGGWKFLRWRVGGWKFLSLRVGG